MVICPAWGRADIGLPSLLSGEAALRIDSAARAATFDMRSRQMRPLGNRTVETKARARGCQDRNGRATRSRSQCSTSLRAAWARRSQEWPGLLSDWHGFDTRRGLQGRNWPYLSGIAWPLAIARACMLQDSSRRDLNTCTNRHGAKPAAIP